MLPTLALVALLVLAVLTVPVWPHSRGWGYLPSGTLAAAVLLLLLLWLLGLVAFRFPWTATPAG